MDPSPPRDATTSRPFLTARWENLILANYRVPRDLLTPRLPPGVVLDEYEGEAWASLVGFQFRQTRVMGISWPGYRHFPEWNLRFYVRHGDQRGVCFIREFVPKRLISTIARVVYNEPYRAAKMREHIVEEEACVHALYEVDWAGRSHRLSVTGSRPPHTPAAGGLEHFFKEHSWGFGVSRRGRLIRYEVAHPEWAVYPVTRCEVDVDWAKLYGSEWESFNERMPDSVLLAAGSGVSVFPHGKTGASDGHPRSGVE